MKKEKHHKQSVKQSVKQTVIVKVGEQAKRKHRRRRRRERRQQQEEIQQQIQAPIQMPVVAYRTGYGGFPLIQGAPVQEPTRPPPRITATVPVMEDVGTGTHGFADIPAPAGTEEVYKKIKPAHSEMVRVPEENVFPSKPKESDKQLIPPPPEGKPIREPWIERFNMYKADLESMMMANEPPTKTITKKQYEQWKDREKMFLEDLRSQQMREEGKPIVSQAEVVQPQPQEHTKVSAKKERAKLLKEFKGRFPDIKTNRYSNEQLQDILSGKTNVVETIKKGKAILDIITGKSNEDTMSEITQSTTPTVPLYEGKQAQAQAQAPIIPEGGNVIPVKGEMSLAKAQPEEEGQSLFSKVLSGAGTVAKTGLELYQVGKATGLISR